MVKYPLAMQETRVRSLGWEDLLEEEAAAYSSTPAWRIPWTERPCGLQSMGSQSQTQLSTNTHIHCWLVKSTKSFSHLAIKLAGLSLCSSFILEVFIECQPLLFEKKAKIPGVKGPLGIHILVGKRQ